MSEARSGQEDPGPWPFLPARAQSTAGCIPSFLHPLYVTMANPHVVLCTAEVPQGIRASWGAGQQLRCWAGLGAPCPPPVGPLGPRLWREENQKVESQSVGPGGLRRLDPQDLI